MMRRAVTNATAAVSVVEHGGLSGAQLQRMLGTRLPQTLPALLHAPPPLRVALPLQYRLQSLQPLVEVGDKVDKGQPLALYSPSQPPVAGGKAAIPVQAFQPALTAPVSGTVMAMEPRPVAEIPWQLIPSIIIENDGEDRWLPALGATPSQTRSDVSQHPGQDVKNNASNADGNRDTLLQAAADQISPQLRAQHIERLFGSAQTGLGGAGFSSLEKLRSSLHTAPQTLIINAVECEPGISCDAALLRSQPQQVINASRWIGRITGASSVVLAIKEDATQIIAQLAAALATQLPPAGGPSLQILRAKNVYPAGAERLLAQAVSGIKIAAGERMTEHGLLMFNVATVSQLYDAARTQRPATTRILTLCGNALPDAMNVVATIGTPIKVLIDFISQQQTSTPTVTHSTVRMDDPALVVTRGGLLSGTPVPDIDAAITSSTNCLIIDNKPTTTVGVPARGQREQPCIRCGACDPVCPARLLPQEMQRFIPVNSPGAEAIPVTAAALQSLSALQLDACLLCGCCDTVCPSHIPLTERFRAAQQTQLQANLEAQRADSARARFDAREQRLQQRQQQREQRLQQRKQQLAGQSTKRTNDVDTADTTGSNTQTQTQTQSTTKVSSTRAATGAANRATTPTEVDSSPAEPLLNTADATTSTTRNISAPELPNSSAASAPKRPDASAIAAAAARARARKQRRSNDSQPPPASDVSDD